MIFLEVLVEGDADILAVREVLARHFGLQEKQEFRVHPHRGKGRLPENPNARPDPKHRGLLDQLPAKLRGYAHLPEGYCIIVLFDADNEDCRDLLAALMTMYEQIDRRPGCVLFRIAIEETESWFIADRQAVQAGYPTAKVNRLPMEPDTLIGAWERLAEAIGEKVDKCVGRDKYQWAQRIVPHLDLENPRSPSLRAFIRGIKRILHSSL